MKEQQFLELMKRRVLECRRIKRISNLSNYDFEVLSTDISEVSKIAVSSTTLKRLFGKRKTEKGAYAPQIQTKNAISIFLGYNDWEDFKISNHHKSSLKFPWKKSYYIYAATSILFLIIGFQIYHQKTIRSAFIQIEKNNSYAPSTIYLNSYIPQLPLNNNYYLDFGDGKPRKLSDGHSTISHLYMSSGFYHITLLRKDQPIDSVSVLIKSSGWEISALKPDSEYKPLLKQTFDNPDSVMHVSPKHLSQEGYDTTSVYYIEIRNFKEYPYIADNINVGIDFKNPISQGGRDCAGIALRLVCEGGQTDINFQRTGCSYWVDLRLNEKLISGRDRPMEQFSIDINDWRHLELDINDKKVNIILDQNHIFSDQYSQPLGALKGVVLYSAGSASFKNLSIK